MGLKFLRNLGASKPLGQSSPAIDSACMSDHRGLRGQGQTWHAWFFTEDTNLPAACMLATCPNLIGRSWHVADIQPSSLGGLQSSLKRYQSQQRTTTDRLSTRVASGRRHWLPCRSPAGPQRTGLLNTRGALPVLPAARRAHTLHALRAPALAEEGVGRPHLYAAVRGAPGYEPHRGQAGSMQAASAHMEVVCRHQSRRRPWRGQ